MNTNEFKQMLYWCKCCHITTLGKLAMFKAIHNLKTNSELLNALNEFYCTGGVR